MKYVFILLAGLLGGCATESPSIDEPVPVCQKIQKKPEIKRSEEFLRRLRQIQKRTE